RTQAMISHENITPRKQMETQALAGKRELERTNTRLLQVNRELEVLATIDGLTGIANRRAFDRRLESEWKRCGRNERPLSLLLVDVDWFKRYNDGRGHAQGDDCLKQVAQTIVDAALRPGDLVARYGGDEFAVILPDTPVEGAEHV